MNGKVRAKNEDGFLLSLGKEDSSIITSEDYHENQVYSSGILDLDWLVSVIIDGMGGMGDGDIARDVLLQSFQSTFHSQAVQNIEEIFDQNLEKGNQFLLNVKSANRYKDMGAVVSSGLFYKSNFYISHIGDARIYLHRERTLKCLTSDHTYLNQFLKSKNLTLEEAKTHPLRNMVLKSLGFENVIHPDKFTVPFFPGDLFLFLTDGVYGELSHSKMETILNQENSLASRMDELVQATFHSECKDNFTAISVQML